MSSHHSYDLCLRNGRVVDGGGGASFAGDVALRGDRIAYVGPRAQGDAQLEVELDGAVVAPGFINMLSWASESLLLDGLAQSDLRQGITLEVMGEGWSMGPHTPRTRAQFEAAQTDIRYPIEWTTLDEYLRLLERRGVAVNVASYVGAITLRQCVLGDDAVQPTAAQLDAMCELAEQAMRDGALGVASAIPYAPGSFAGAEELRALAAVAGRNGGLYATHIRSESHTVLEALDEAIAVARQNQMPVHIYHLKSAGETYADRFSLLVDKIAQARCEGLAITADMYCYTSAWAALSIGLPPWAQAGGLGAFIQRMGNAQTRARVIAEIASAQTEWENYYQLAGADQTLLLGFRTEQLKAHTGRTLAEVAALRGKSPEETLVDLVVEDQSPVLAAFNLVSEQQVSDKVRIPWIAFGSDASAPSCEGVFLASHPHPRAYGNVARLLGHYVRDEKLLPLEQAVHRLSGFAADTLGLRERGRLREGNFADVVVFDPAMVEAHSTFAQPHQYATGVQQVWVNGVWTLRDGKPTGACGGRVVRGPGADGGKR